MVIVRLYLARFFLLIQEILKKGLNKIQIEIISSFQNFIYSLLAARHRDDDNDYVCIPWNFNGFN